MNSIDESQLLEEQKREKRRKRRKKNQILVYFALMLMIGLLGTGVYFGILYWPKPVDNGPTQEDIAQGLAELDEPLEEETATPEIEEVVPQLTEEEKLDQIIEAAIETMSLEDRVAGLFIVSTEGLTGYENVTLAGETTQQLLTQYPVGGIIYFEENMQDSDKFKEMIATTVSYSKYPLFLAVDEEGGSVSRLASAGFMDAVDSAYEIGQTADPANAYNAGATIAASMAEYGLNLNLAPVADLNILEDNSMGDRVYGSDAIIAGSMVSSMVKGLEENAISACLKHFPGIASTIEDTHDEMAVSDRTLEDFLANEFVVFEQGIAAGVDFIMIGHLSVPSITSNNVPSSLSEAVVTNLLREQLGYEGVIITDSLAMTAITEYYTSEQAAVLALKAGCDMILMPNDFESAYNGVLDAIANGTISEERINDSLKRIYKIKYSNRLESN